MSFTTLLFVLRFKLVRQRSFSAVKINLQCDDVEDEFQFQYFIVYYLISGGAKKFLYNGPKKTTDDDDDEFLWNFNKNTSKDTGIILVDHPQSLQAVFVFFNKRHFQP